MYYISTATNSKDIFIADPPTRISSSLKASTHPELGWACITSDQANAGGTNSCKLSYCPFPGRAVYESITSWCHRPPLNMTAAFSGVLDRAAGKVRQN